MNEDEEESENKQTVMTVRFLGVILDTEAKDEILDLLFMDYFWKKDILVDIEFSEEDI